MAPERVGLAGRRGPDARLVVDVAEQVVQRGQVRHLFGRDLLDLEVLLLARLEVGGLAGLVEQLVDLGVAVEGEVAGVVGGEAGTDRRRAR